MGAAGTEQRFKIPRQSKYFQFRLRPSHNTSGSNLYWYTQEGAYASGNTAAYTTLLTNESSTIPMPLAGQTIYFVADQDNQALEISYISNV